MCTAATYLTKDFYFGRTLDYEFTHGEQVTILPRDNSRLHQKKDHPRGWSFLLVKSKVRKSNAAINNEAI